MSENTGGSHTDILLDAGTNELEVLVFRMNKGWYGVNVAKVREVIRPAKTIAAPHQHPSVLGMFNIRSVVMPVVDLGLHLGIKSQAEKGQSNAGEGRVIITEFNGLRTGFLVDVVEQIHRISWKSVRPTPDLNTSSTTTATLGVTTGIVQLGDRLVLMIDFESVADAIMMDEKLHISSIDNELGVDRSNKRVILVEDSPFMRDLIRRTFLGCGYDKAEIYSDGQEALEAIEAEGRAPIDAIISDIEMPRVDGLHLCRRVRENVALRTVPIVLFSSLISSDNRKKGEQVGATAQIPKPELAEMVRIVDRVVSGLPAQAVEVTTAGVRAAA